MSYKPSDSVTVEFTTSNPSTGAAVNADSTPTGTFARNGTDDGAVTVTVTNVDTGRYKAAFTIPSGASAGDTCTLLVAATVSSIAGKGIVWQTVVDRLRITDIVDSSQRVDLGKWLGSAPNALSSGRVEVLVGAVASGVIAAASFAANALDAVWSTTTRILTAGTNIVLAKGTGVTGFNDLSDANVQADVQTALTNQGYTTARADYLDVLNGLVAAIWASATRTLSSFGTLVADIVAAIAAQIVSDHGSGSYVRNTEPDNSGISVAASAATSAASDAAAVRTVTDGLVQTAGKLWVLNESGDPIANDMIAAIDAIKGVGWAVETLKAIYDAIGSVGTPPTVSEISDAIGGEILEDGHTRDDSWRISMRGVAAKTSGMEPGSTQGAIRDMADTKDSVVAVLDGLGNRTEITTADGT